MSKLNQSIGSKQYATYEENHGYFVWYTMLHLTTSKLSNQKHDNQEPQAKRKHESYGTINTRGLNGRITRSQTQKAGLL